MNLKRLIKSTIFSLLGFSCIGITSFVFSNNSSNSTAVQEAKADANGTDVYFSEQQDYMKLGESYLHYWGPNSMDGWIHLTDNVFDLTDKNEKVYKATIPSGASGFEYQIKNKNENDAIKYSLPISNLTNNIGFRENGWEEVSTNYWKFKVATYTVYPYTLTYSANGGTGSMPNKQCYGNVECSIDPSWFSRTYYSFFQWEDDAGTRYNWDDKLPVKQNTSTVNLKVIWTSNYTVLGDFNSWAAPGLQMETSDGNYWSAYQELDYLADRETYNYAYGFKVRHPLTGNWFGGNYIFKPSSTGPDTLIQSGGNNLGISFGNNNWQGRKIIVHFEFYLSLESKSNVLYVTQNAQKKVTLNTNGGSAVNPVYKYADEKINSSSDIGTTTRVGYTFDYWYTTDQDTPVEYPYTVTDDVTFNAHWTLNSYTITYKAHNGTSESDVYDYKSPGADYSIIYSEFSTPDANSAFYYWTTNEDGTGTRYLAGDTYSVDSDLTLYAQWGQNSRYVYFQNNYAWNPRIVPITIKAYDWSGNQIGSSTTLSKIFTNSQGHDIYRTSINIQDVKSIAFFGYYDDKTQEDDNTVKLDLYSNIVVTDDWNAVCWYITGGLAGSRTAAVSYAITVNVNLRAYGEVATNQFFYVGQGASTLSGDLAIAGFTKPTKDHYAFEGYYSENTFNTKVINSDLNGVQSTGYFENNAWIKNENTILYANWIEKYNLVISHETGNPTEVELTFNSTTSTYTVNEVELSPGDKVQLYDRQTKAVVYAGIKNESKGFWVDGGHAQTTDIGLYPGLSEATEFDFVLEEGSTNYFTISYTDEQPTMYAVFVGNKMYPMSLYQEGKESDVKNQYKANVPDLEYGKTIVFKSNQNQNNMSPERDKWSNITTDTNKSIISGSQDFYLKEHNDDSWSEWISGMPKDGYHIIADNPSTSTSYSKAIFYHSDTDEYSKTYKQYVAMKNISEGEFFFAYDASADKTFNFSNVDCAEAVSGSFEKDNSNAKCNTTGTYLFWIKLNSSGNKVWVSSANALVEAQCYAKDFNNCISGQCYDAGGVKEGFKAAWEKEATYFDQLMDSVKNYFTKATASEDTDIKACTKKYDAAFSKNYVALGIDDFMDRFTAEELEELSSMSIRLKMINGDNSPLILVIAVSASLLAVSSLTTIILVRRKKKEK